MLQTVGLPVSLNNHIPAAPLSGWPGSRPAVVTRRFTDWEATRRTREGQLDGTRSPYPNQTPSALKALPFPNKERHVKPATEINTGRPNLRRLRTVGAGMTNTVITASPLSISNAPSSSSAFSNEVAMATLTLLRKEGVAGKNAEPLIGQIHLPGKPIASGNHRAFLRFQEWERANHKYLRRMDTRKRWSLYISDPELRRLRGQYEARHPSPVSSDESPSAGLRTSTV